MKNNLYMIISNICLVHIFSVQKYRNKLYKKENHTKKSKKY